MTEDDLTLGSLGDPMGETARKFYEDLAFLLGEVHTDQIIAKIEGTLPDPWHRLALLRALRRAVPQFSGRMATARSKPAQELLAALENGLRQAGMSEEELMS